MSSPISACLQMSTRCVLQLAITFPLYRTPLLGRFSTRSGISLAGHIGAKAKRLRRRRSICVLQFGHLIGRLFAGGIYTKHSSIPVWQHQAESCSDAKTEVTFSVSRACSDVLTGLAVDHTGRMTAVSSLKGI